MVPAMVVLIASDDRGPLAAAAALFALAAVTDVADGHLARSRNLITRFGRLADPVADKLLVGAALVALVAVDRLALWIALVVLGREVAVCLLRWRAAGAGVELAVSGFGKAKTAAQMIAIPLLMLVSDPGAPWVGAVMVAVAGVTAASGFDYALTYARSTASASASGAVAASRG